MLTPIICNKRGFVPVGCNGHKEAEHKETYGVWAFVVLVESDQFWRGKVWSNLPDILRGLINFIQTIFAKRSTAKSLHRHRGSDCWRAAIPAHIPLGPRAKNNRIAMMVKHNSKCRTTKWKLHTRGPGPRLGCGPRFGLESESDSVIEGLNVVTYLNNIAFLKTWTSCRGYIRSPMECRG